MRTPSEVARQIKKALIAHGIAATARKVSGYQVKVKADGTELSREIAKKIYHQEPHGWLIVWVDNHCLPMPPACG